MNIVNKFPPNIEEIRKVFPLKGTEIFSWGDIIYNPTGLLISEELIAHEYVHEKQQDKDVEAWWERYLIDDTFRLQQELDAHRVEYSVYCSLHKDRNDRVRYLLAIANRLAAPMYGSLISVGLAMKLIKQ